MEENVYDRFKIASESDKFPMSDGTAVYETRTYSGVRGAPVGFGSQAVYSISGFRFYDNALSGFVKLTKQ
jgi:hypothetical protein